VEQHSSATAGRPVVLVECRSQQESAGTAKLAMNVLKENELIFCVQQIADY